MEDEPDVGGGKLEGDAQDIYVHRDLRRQGNPPAYVRPGLEGYDPIILMGEAAPLIKDHIAEQVHGVGIAPLKELMEFLVAREVRISV